MEEEKKPVVMLPLEVWQEILKQERRKKLYHMGYRVEWRYVYSLYWQNELMFVHGKEPNTSVFTSYFNTSADREWNVDSVMERMRSYVGDQPFEIKIFSLYDVCEVHEVGVNG